MTPVNAPARQPSNTGRRRPEDDDAAIDAGATGGPDAAADGDRDDKAAPPIVPADAAPAASSASSASSMTGGVSQYLGVGAAVVAGLGVAVAAGGGSGGGGSQPAHQQVKPDVPAPKPEPEPQPESQRPKPDGGRPGPDGTPTPEQKPEPEPKPTPGQKPEPEQKPTPEQKPEPEQKPTPEQKPEPEQKPTPEQKPEPEQKPTPEQKPEPEQKPTPGQKPEPEQKPIPEQKPEPEQKPTPEQKPEPEQKPTPEQKPEPEQKPDPAPLPAKPQLHLDRDTGAPTAADPTGESLRDRITAIATVRVDGLVPGGRWEYSLDGRTWTAGVGDRIDGAVFGADGAKSVQVRQLATDGRAGAIETLPFILDSQSPAEPAIRLVDDTGLSATDRLTRDPRITVDLPPGVTATYAFDTGETGTLARGQEILAPKLPDGARKVDVILYDGAGNATKTPFEFQLDRTAPVELGLRLVNDTGASATDGITRDGTLQVSGLVQGNRWQYRVNGGGWADGDASMRIEMATLGADGDKLVEVAHIDAAGNQAITPLSFTLDRVALAPVIRLAHDTGSSASDNITSVAQVRIDGLEKDATWELIGVNNFNAAGSAAGNILTVPSELNMWTRARQIDLAGNVSKHSTALQAWVTTEEIAASQTPTVDMRVKQSAALMGTEGQDTFVLTAWATTKLVVLTNYSHAQGDVLDLSAILTLAPGQSIHDVLWELPTQAATGRRVLEWRRDDGAYGPIELWNVALTDNVLVRTGDGLHVL
ncbi:Ig-like domain-containing protein [Mitsuaria sp. GD03876]|uniref:Ig-like domain-containing protein n=1 Tax=Mitsuaria sp. GD03876 TaxID=2975399 RepID=UPI002447D909|nr:Ig-like domain-containing protein [Mitsuaria sp. GD03876]MDH0865166.1 Ig-like domain-containing protein [Mitsuaria sp. GD03876]